MEEVRIERGPAERLDARYDFWKARSNCVPWRVAPRTLVERRELWRGDRWFPDGDLNLLDAVLPEGSHSALVWRDEEGHRSDWSRSKLRERVLAIAAELERRVVGRGDRVAVWGPPQPGIFAALLAPAAIGAMAVPLYSGFAPAAAAQRIAEAGARCAVVSARGVYDGKEREWTVDLPTGVDEVIVDPCSLESAPDFEPWTCAAGVPWQLLFTSGTTARPKGILWGQGPSLVKCQTDVVVNVGVRPGDRVLWVTDTGWTVMPWLAAGALSNGASLVLLEGKVTSGRLWSACAEEGVTQVGISPSLARRLREEEPDPRSRWDLRKLHTIASTGEPWDRDTWEWIDAALPNRYHANVSGGTEAGCLLLAPRAWERVPPTSVGRPTPGISVSSLFRADGARELVVTDSWPGMTQGLWNDPDGERFAESYFTTADPNIWVHGDEVDVDDGWWYVRGRSDDALKVRGKRIAAQEIEQIAWHLCGECAAVQDGEGYALWVTRIGPDLEADLAGLIEAHLGPGYRPSRIVPVPELPRTPSGKVRRRQMREAF